MHLSSAVALVAALWLGLGVQAAENPPRLLEDARVGWRTTDGLGSLSGITVNADGSRVVAVSDKGSFVSGRLRRDGTGAITGVERLASGPLLDPRGNAVTRFDVDAEGMALGPDGRLYVSFEANHRVWAYSAMDQAADPLPQPAEFRALQNNSGLEALFTGPDGLIHAIPERSGKLDRPFPVYRFAQGDWSRAFGIPRRPPHLITGADVGPDGRLYVLERHWNGLLGFSTRIRRFAMAAGGIHGEEVLLESRIGQYDNLEGLSSWRDAQGRVRLLLVSDDNASFFQRTELVEFIVDNGGGVRPVVRPRGG